MSHYPYYGGPGGPPPPGHWPPPPHYGYPPAPPHDGGAVNTGPQAAPGYPYYLPAMMVPVAPMPAAMPGPMPGPPADQPSNPTYITNYIYHGEGSGNSGNPAIVDKVQVVELAGEFDWVPSTATTAAVHLTGQAVVGGHEGWDGSPLWVIRSWHNGDLIPGKLSVRHNSASVMYNGKEIFVQNIEVLVSKPETLKWVSASHGSIPPGAIPGGRTATGETLYVGRARYQLSLTPGKVHPSHNCCYIAFAGQEVSHKMYDVLCRV